jgi:hypothetical protein
MNTTYSFSSYTKGLYPYTLNKQADSVEITLLFPEDFRPKLEKRLTKFPSLLSVDGVCAEMISFAVKKENQESFQVMTKIAKEAFSHSSLAHLQDKGLVSIGMLSHNPNKYLLTGKPGGTVSFVSGEVANGFNFREELRFECSQEQFERLSNCSYIGLNGTGLFIQGKEEVQNRFYFWVHAGKETREKSIFNKDVISTSEKCTLTLPY